MPYLVIFGPELLKAIVVFQMSTFKFVTMQNFRKKPKWPNVRPAMPYLGIFGLEF